MESMEAPRGRQIWNRRDFRIMRQISASECRVASGHLGDGASEPNPDRLARRPARCTRYGQEDVYEIRPILRFDSGLTGANRTPAPRTRGSAGALQPGRHFIRFRYRPNLVEARLRSLLLQSIAKAQPQAL